jgi:hypothetical protein
LYCLVVLISIHEGIGQVLVNFSVLFSSDFLASLLYGDVVGRKLRDHVASLIIDSTIIVHLVLSCNGLRQ